MEKENELSSKSCLDVFSYFLNKQLNHSKNKYIIRIIETDSDAVYKPRVSHSRAQNQPLGKATF